MACGELDLDLIPGGWVDDRFVMPCDVALRDFAFVDLRGLGEEVGDNGLLDQDVASVFLVAQQGADCGRSPPGVASGGAVAFGFEYVLDLDDRFAIQEELVDASDGWGLGLVDDHGVALAALVAEDVGVGDDGFAVCEAFAVAPRDIFGDRA